MLGRRGRPERRHRAIGDAGRERSQFDDVVDQLTDDPAWRRRVVVVHLGHWGTSAGSWTLHGLAGLGCWFTGVPPQRCAGSATRARSGIGPDR